MGEEEEGRRRRRRRRGLSAGSVVGFGRWRRMSEGEEAKVDCREAKHSYHQPC